MNFVAIYKSSKERSWFLLESHMISNDTESEEGSVTVFEFNWVHDRKISVADRLWLKYIRMSKSIVDTRSNEIIVSGKKYRRFYTALITIERVTCDSCVNQPISTALSTFHRYFIRYIAKTCKCFSLILSSVYIKLCN